MQIVPCPHCHEPLESDETLGGKEVECPHCNGRFWMPPFTAVSPPPFVSPVEMPPKRQRPLTPNWFLPAGCIALLAAAGAVFLGSAAAFMGRVRGGEAVLVFALTTALNPLFFAGLPLSLYWLDRYRKDKGLPWGVPDVGAIVVLLIVAVVVTVGLLLAQ